MFNEIKTGQSYLIAEYDRVLKYIFINSATVCLKSGYTTVDFNVTYTDNSTGEQTNKNMSYFQVFEAVCRADKSLKKYVEGLNTTFGTPFVTYKLDNQTIICETFSDNYEDIVEEEVLLTDDALKEMFVPSFAF